MENAAEKIQEYVETLPLLDTHEHLTAREELRDRQTDVLQEYLIHYFNRDLLSAGLRPSDLKIATQHALPLLQRWKILQPYWDIARFTGYGRALDIAARGLYGLDGISTATIERLNDCFLGSLKPGHFAHVLHNRSRIKVCLLDKQDQVDLNTDNLGADPTFFRPVYRLDTFIYPRLLGDIQKVEQDLNTDICSFQDWQEACELSLDRAVSHGMIALKSGLAYERPLLYERVTHAEAERSFNSVLERRHLPDWLAAPVVTDKAFQDYMMHFVLGLANRRELAFQFHTGLQEGNGNYILTSDPALLSNLFLQYPKVRFDLFHIGYPFQHVLSALAKNFPNVFIDMCWAHIVSPEASVRALEEWLDAVPYNKISAFGGDYAIVDAVYGHQVLARRNVSRTLGRKISEGCFDVQTARVIARRLLYDNPMEIFRLQQKGIAEDTEK